MKTKQNKIAFNNLIRLNLKKKNNQNINKKTVKSFKKFKKMI